MDLISVIVPIYKVETYLNRCVESIVHQTYKNLEIILVDDGSPDNCPALCDEWAQKDNRIRVIHKSNGGLSDARNAGLHIANGEYISFVDSDDWLAPEFYALLLTTLQDTKSDISMCKVQKVWKSEDAQILVKDVYEHEVLDTIQALHELIVENKIQQVVWNKLYKRKIVENLPFEKGKCNEDEFWSYQAFGRAKRSVRIEYTGYYYFQREGSIMSTSYSLQRLDALEAKNYRQRYLEQYFPQLASDGRKNLFLTCLYSGQMTMKYLKDTERETAIKKINDILKHSPLQKCDFKDLSVLYRLWWYFAKVSIRTTCIVRNLLKIGM